MSSASRARVLLSGRARRAAEPALRLLRSRGRPVAWTPDFMGWGNLLFLLLWADIGGRFGEERLVLESDRLTPWLQQFPRLQPLSVSRRAVRLTDQRVMPWRESAKAQQFGHAHERGFTDAEMSSFLARYLVPELESKDRDGTRLVLNVRRGDYYSVPTIRKSFGFDVEAYVRFAIDASVKTDGPLGEIHVVSDDLDWCRQCLGWLDTYSPLVTYADPGDGAVANFVSVAQGRRLVITNSTFSYWAAYVSTALHGNNHSNVWAPRFFDRSQNDGRGWLLDERWSIVEHLPAGWDEPGVPLA